jgi:arabinose-5-phosphate isomerase
VDPVFAKATNETVETGYGVTRSSPDCGRDAYLNAVSFRVMRSELNAAKVVARAREVLAIESAAVAALAGHIDEHFVAACRLIYACSGRVVVTGMGKSGHIGDKIAATLASTGTPAFFLHAAEASHGDIGMITPADVLLALSNSGETAELIALLPVIKRLNVGLVALTGKPQSTLGRAADVVLDVSVPKEACPLNLAPTASTTATLAMGDALAVALLDARGFTEEDFARSHPGGSLGRRLLLHVEDVMRKGDQLPAVSPTTKLRDGLLEMSRKGLGMTTIVDAQQRVVGVFTDGDLRRVLDKHFDPDLAMSAVMTANPKSARPRMLAAEAVHIMETSRITALPVVDDTGVLVGAFNVHDLLRAGVM